jgi:hypothetical protein
MSKVNTIIEEVEEELYEDWQYEHSSQLASEYIENSIFVELDKFDFENTDENYVEGTATLGLFLELIPRIIDLGYDRDMLLAQVEEYIEEAENRTFH